MGPFPPRPPSTSEIIAHCNAYFEDTPCEAWTYEAFLNHYVQVAPVVLGLVHSRYVRALEFVEDAGRKSTTEADTRRRQKARALLNQHRASHHRRSVPGKEKTTFVNGVSVTAGGDITGTSFSVGNSSDTRDPRPAAKRGRDGGWDSAAKRHASAPPGPPRHARRTASAEPVVHNAENSRNRATERESAAPTAVSDAAGDEGLQPAAEDVQPAADDTHRNALSPEIEIARHLVSFVAKYKAMACKVPLIGSDVFLEDRIYRCVQRAADDVRLQGNAILEWILDLQDPFVSTWFTGAEKEQLRGLIPALPARDPAFEYAAARFPQEPASPGALWDIIESSSRPAGEPYDRRRHSTATYVNCAAASILSTIESYANMPMMGPESFREGWFGHNIWSALIDRCLHTIPQVLVSRTEIKSRASSQRQRFDAVILAQLDLDEQPAHAYGHPHEFGAIEVARVTAATAPAKQDIDRGKLVTVLADMLDTVRKTVGDEPEVMEKMQVVGIQNVGFRISVWTMHMAGANVKMLHRGRGRTVPMTVAGFGKVVDVMRAVIRAKGIIQSSVEAVVQWSESRKALEEDEL